MHSQFDEDPAFPIDAWFFHSIMADMPKQALLNCVTMKFSHLALVDPSFASPSLINVLLGADIFVSIIDSKYVVVGDTLLVAFGSIFGWILIGPVPPSLVNNLITVPVSLTTFVEVLMDRFWPMSLRRNSPKMVNVNQFSCKGVSMANSVFY